MLSWSALMSLTGYFFASTVTNAHGGFEAAGTLAKIATTAVAKKTAKETSDVCPATYRAQPLL